MANPILQLLFLVLFSASALSQGSRLPIELQTSFPVSSESKLKHGKTWGDVKTSLIGSVAPTCTYNECRGCKYKCRAEQVPVEGNDPINSAYHYKCVCHR